MIEVDKLRFRANSILLQIQKLEEDLRYCYKEDAKLYGPTKARIAKLYKSWWDNVALYCQAEKARLAQEKIKCEILDEGGYKCA